MALERLLHDAALDAAAAAVDEPHFGQACFGGSVHVFLNDRRDVARGERMEIDFGFDGDADGVIRHGQSAVALPSNQQAQARSDHQQLEPGTD